MQGMQLREHRQVLGTRVFKGPGSSNHTNRFFRTFSLNRKSVHVVFNAKCNFLRKGFKISETWNNWYFKWPFIFVISSRNEHWSELQTYFYCIVHFFIQILFGKNKFEANMRRLEKVSGYSRHLFVADCVTNSTR